MDSTQPTKKTKTEQFKAIRNDGEFINLLKTVDKLPDMVYDYMFIKRVFNVNDVPKQFEREIKLVSIFCKKTDGDCRMAIPLFASINSYTGLMYCHKKSGLNLDDIIYVVVTSSNFELLNWVEKELHIKLKKSTVEDEVMEKILARNDLTCTQNLIQLVEKDIIDVTDKLYISAVDYNNITFVKYLTEQKFQKFKKYVAEAMEVAIFNGNLELIDYLNTVNN